MVLDATGALQCELEQRHAQRGPSLPSTTQPAPMTAVALQGLMPFE